METADFLRVFESGLVEPLSTAGFRVKGKTVFFLNPQITIALIRLGGRMASPGRLAHVLCFRHTYLRGVQAELGKMNVPSDFVFKFRPSEINRLSVSRWKYRPQNLRYDYDTFDYRPVEESFATRWVRDLAGFIQGPFRGWAEALSAAEALRQLRESGDDAWCERRWIQDYEAHLARLSGP